MGNYATNSIVETVSLLASVSQPRIIFKAKLIGSKLLTRCRALQLGPTCLVMAKTIVTKDKFLLGSVLSVGNQLFLFQDVDPKICKEA